MLVNRKSIIGFMAAITLLGAVPVRAEPGEYPQSFFRQFCIECHSGDDAEGSISLEEERRFSVNQTELWQKVLTQLSAGEMPPDDSAQPQLDEREAMIAWVGSEMRKAGVTPHDPGGPLPEDGNRIAHERLFSGVHKGPASSPPRFWRRSQPQYDSLMETLWVIPRLRYEKAYQRSDPAWAGYSYSQPFPGLNPEMFTNFSGSIHADEAVLRALLEAGGQIAERLTSDDTLYAKELQPPIAVGVPSIRRGSEWERFKQDPPARPAAFEPFITATEPPTQAEHAAAVHSTFELLLNRPPDSDEMERYARLLHRSTEKSGPLAGLRGLITAVFVSPEFVFRMEIGLGEKDEHGRRMLSSDELVYAIAFALTDSGPDEPLLEAARTGKLNTKSDVEREVRRILADDSIEKHRRLRFFQEFFGYHRVGEVFKDKSGWEREAPYLVRDADLLVEHVLRKDRNVLRELLTTDRYFVAYPKIDDPELFAAIVEKTIADTEAQIEKNKQRGRKIEADRQGKYNRAFAHIQGRTLIPKTVHGDRASFEANYITIYGFDGATFEWTANQPIAVPGRRAGLLTHPAWLVSHSTNFDNDVVRRGKWIRERLLAGRIPDVPIDVEAQVPDEPDSSLRHRMRVTREARCIGCHRRMDPLGLPFEIYDHYGHFRDVEMVGARKNKPLPIDASGAIIASGDPKLDAPVADAIELVHRLADSPLVRQSFVRHAFRYWMARNERLSDSPTLIAADQAYANSKGSFTELLVSLLTSDSFLYRK